MPFAILSLDYCKRNEGKIGDVNQAIETLKALSISNIKRQGTTPSERLAFVAAWYKNAVILRLRLLEGGASSEYNSRNFMSSAVLVRQLIETAAHFIATFIDVEKHLKKMPPGIEEVNDKVTRALFGSKVKGHSQAIPPMQILNCIDATDKLLSKAVKKKSSPIREHYDFLSEFVHPNSYAFLYHTDFSAPSEPAEVKFFPEGNEATANLMSSHIFAGMQILMLFLHCERQASGLLSTLPSNA